VKRLSGFKLLEEREGEGRQAEKGDRIVYNTRIFLNQGDEIPLNDIQAKQVPKEMIRIVDGVTFIDQTIVLGQRQAITGIEHALLGMKAGSYRKVRIGPPLAYRDKGIPDLIPPDAMLIAEIWLREISQERRVGTS
jgi:FKBP-type peptidyl-prolyl cis-trans isomerase (trigger factor)